MRNEIKKFCKEYGVSQNLQIRYIDLVSEVGELGKEILKGGNYGTKPYSQTSSLEEEVGDCLCSLLMICNICDIDFETAAKASLQKCKDRFVKTGTIGSER